MIRVPRLWPNATIVCLGTGPSLAAEDVNACRDRARVIAVKDAIDMAPWADALYACGADQSRWWERRGDELACFDGMRFTLDPAAERWARVLRNTGVSGLERDPSGLKTGKNSGAQAINLAVHLGAAKIVLLGYDMTAAADGRAHFFGAHPHGLTPPFVDFRPWFEPIAEALRSLGIAIVNASRRTSLTCFPRQSLLEALA